MRIYCIYYHAINVRTNSGNIHTPLCPNKVACGPQAMRHHQKQLGQDGDALTDLWSCDKAVLSTLSSSQKKSGSSK